MEAWEDTPPFADSECSCVIARLPGPMWWMEFRRNRAPVFASGVPLVGRVAARHPCGVVGLS
jgi:hypothetical protein